MPPREPERAPPIGRLLRRPDFLAAASGRRFHTRLMTVQGRLRDDADGLRVGLTVTKKVGHATERNRIKRRLRTAAQAAGAPHAAKAADVVVIARRDALAAEWSTLVDDLGRALHMVTKPPESEGKERPSRDRRPKPPRPHEPAAEAKPRRAATPPSPDAGPPHGDNDGSPHA